MKTGTRKIGAAALLCAVAAALLCAAALLWGAPVRARADDTAQKTIERIEYAERQVISYGKLLADEIDNTAVVHYTDGTQQTSEIEFGNIVANTGVNVNFTTTDITGVVKGTDRQVTCTVTTMPDDLVYFVNAGSVDHDGKYEDTADPYYDYNQTLFDHYDTLLNSVPDQTTTKGSDKWGCYTSSTWTAPGDGTFPYNSLRWTEDALDMGYNLTDLTAGAAYRVYVGTLSHWHARTCTITFNGATVGSELLRIASSKGFSVYENVTADGNGKIDVHMQGASTNEPCITFIAVQPMTSERRAVPSALTAPPTVGMEDTSVTFTAGVQEGAKIQLYNAVKPNQVIYEEAVDMQKAGDNGEYTVDWGAPLDGITQLSAVQITNGGVSTPLLISVTDIENFSALPDSSDYTTGSVTITVCAQAKSGIASYSYQNGEFGAVHTVELDRPFAIRESFTVSENGSYIIVVTSGLGVTYSETVEITNIDPDRPVITLTPHRNGWQSGAYNVKLAVATAAPVTQYALYKNGETVASAAVAPATISFTATGEYTVYVKNAAGQSSVLSVRVSDIPTQTTVTRRYANRTLTFTFGDNTDHAVASVSAYMVDEGGVSRMTISAGNAMDVFGAGTYVVTVTDTDGAVEMFALQVAASDLRAPAPSSGGLGKSAQLGIGLGVGLGGVLLAAAAVVVTVLLFKKKSA